MRRIWAGAVAMVALSWLAVPISAFAAGQTVTVAVGGRTLIHYLPLTLADRLGFFREEGLDVDVEDLAGGQKAIEALIAGSADFMVGASDFVFLLQPKGIDIVLLALNSNTTGIVVGLSPEKAKLYHSPADLKGLTIGITAPGSATEDVLSVVLRKGGLALSDVSTVAVGAGPSAVAAMKAHRLDGLVMADPVIMRLTEDGDLVPVIDSRVAAGQKFIYGALLATGGSFATAQTIKDRPAVVQSFVNATVHAIKWMHKVSTDEIVDAVPPEFYGNDRALYAKSVAASLASMSAEGLTTMEEVKGSYDQMVKAGRLKETDYVDLARAYTNQFVERALKKY